MSYAVGKKRTEPYAKIEEELPQMRREIVQLVRQAVRVGRRACMIVNNRGEGNAPLTVQALTEMLSKEQRPGLFLGRACTITSEFPWRSRLIHNTFVVAVFPSRLLK